MDTSSIQTGNPALNPAFSIPPAKSVRNHTQNILNRMLKAMDALYANMFVKEFLAVIPIFGVAFASTHPITAAISIIVPVSLHIILGSRYIANKRQENLNRAKEYSQKRDEIVKVKEKATGFIADIKACKTIDELASKSTEINNELNVIKETLPKLGTGYCPYYHGDIIALKKIEERCQKLAHQRTLPTIDLSKLITSFSNKLEHLVEKLDEHTQAYESIIKTFQPKR